ncbi:MAG TPA: hypothetical protein VEI07_04335 [Planctomycetaceae bacterium]|nr:hypothetical protein [Planctomycetaceae bacterium]
MRIDDRSGDLSNAQVHIAYETQPGVVDSPLLKDLVKSMLLDFLRQTILDRGKQYELRDPAPGSKSTQAQPANRSGEVPIVKTAVAPTPIILLPVNGVEERVKKASAPGKRTSPVAVNQPPKGNQLSPATGMAHTPVSPPTAALPIRRPSTTSVAKISPPILQPQAPPSRAVNTAFPGLAGLSRTPETLFAELGFFPRSIGDLSPESSFDIAYACYTRGLYRDAVVMADHGLALRNDARLEFIKGVCQLHLGQPNPTSTAKAYFAALAAGKTYGLALALERINDPMSVRFQAIQPAAK